MFQRLHSISPYLQPRENYDLFENMKNILYAIKIYNYLWTGKYIYSNSELFEKIKEKDKISAQIFEDAIKVANDVKHDGSTIRSVKGDYFLMARKMYRDKIELFEHLQRLDNEYCKATGMVEISQDFLSYQAFVDNQTSLEIG